MTPFEAKLIANEQAGAGMRKLIFSAAAAFDGDISPGQFAHIKVPNAGELLLRRPISIMDADAAEKTLTFAVQLKGRGTELICAMEPGDETEMIAPLGKGFSIGGAKRVWLMGGGVGTAPMVYTARRFSKQASLTAIAGFRSGGEAFAVEELRQCCGELVICTDDGSLGIKGTVIDGAKTLADIPDLICACGPTPMLRAVREFALKNDIPCQLSLEQRMGCGYGACLTCSCKTRDAGGQEDFSRVCADGPVFDAKEVLL